MVGSVTDRAGKHLMMILCYILFISVIANGLIAKPLVLFALVRRVLSYIIYIIMHVICHISVMKMIVGTIVIPESQQSYRSQCERSSDQCYQVRGFVIRIFSNIMEYS